jgi:2-oxo-4-hydroxy-4-carboxy-5-ureidoimidazoline decarboxylase
MEPSRRLDLASADEARMLLRTCCGATRWVEAMVARRPFGTDSALLAAAREIWVALTPTDWLEAFAHHPRIGDRKALRTRLQSTAHLSAREQSGIDGAADGILTELAALNTAYERRFGYIFIVCATGKSAGEMLELLRQRIRNDPHVEIRLAVEEQAKITALRLQALARTE